MATLNKIILIGHLGRDPEVREYEGRKVANFSLAVNERYRKSDGSMQESTEWFRVSFWGNTAEVAEKYLKKGDQVYVEGRLRSREYTDNEGQKRFALEVSGQSMTMLGSAGGNDAATGDSNSYQASNSPTSNSSSNEVREEFPPQDSEEGDLPF